MATAIGPRPLVDVIRNAAGFAKAENFLAVYGETLAVPLTAERLFDLMAAWDAVPYEFQGFVRAAIKPGAGSDSDLPDFLS